ncbi:hypothetical protein BGZ96_009069 [Linnemannia gamsii]|uniref:Uncharacterized protein n=1 Tax=Linnemannia gamsii TaxID=64522 RepID=A0ABQ7JX57_9FUNG|nr:hypothetical protein BGZ96_009069 [Linnemannia gamsii]
MNDRMLFRRQVDCAAVGCPLYRLSFSALSDLFSIADAGISAAAKALPDATKKVPEEVTSYLQQIKLFADALAAAKAENFEGAGTMKTFMDATENLVALTDFVIEGAPNLSEPLPEPVLPILKIISNSLHEVGKSSDEYIKAECAKNK